MGFILVTFARGLVPFNLQSYSGIGLGSLKIAYSSLTCSTFMFLFCVLINLVSVAAKAELGIDFALD